MLDWPTYFGLPLIYWIYSKSLVTSTQLFELGYPAHPTIIERRRRAINRACFFAPSMLKNEIEFMHGKLSGVRTEEELANTPEEDHDHGEHFVMIEEWDSIQDRINFGVASIWNTALTNITRVFKRLTFIRWSKVLII